VRVSFLFLCRFCGLLLRQDLCQVKLNAGCVSLCVQQWRFTYCSSG
jgi:hypothetical protein